MSTHRLAAVGLAIGLLAPTLAQARFSFQMGDWIWADGQSFTPEEYEQYKKANPDGPPPKQPPAQQYQYPYQSQYQPQTQPQYQPAYAPQVQAPATTTMVNGQPVVTVAPPPVAAPLPIESTNVAAMPPRHAPPPSYAAAPAPAPALRAASCRTMRAYDEFPGDTEKFDCGAAGKLTRPEMMAQGWKIDFVEKVPPAGYKIILSR